MLCMTTSDVMTRTTLNLDATVVRELRRRGISERKSMGTVASELLVRALAQDALPDPPEFRWFSKHMGQPLVDLEDKEAANAVLDGRK
jgi:hypothetical protein